MRKALADYTANTGNRNVDPTIDKDELIARIVDTVNKTALFLSENDFDLRMLIDAKDFEKISYIEEAANAVCISIEDKKTFTTYALEISRLKNILIMMI